MVSFLDLFCFSCVDDYCLSLKQTVLVVFDVISGKSGIFYHFLSLLLGARVGSTCNLVVSGG